MSKLKHRWRIISIVIVMAVAILISGYLWTYREEMPFKPQSEEQTLISIGQDSALIIVDVQIDFLPGGSLPVPEGDAVVPILNEYIIKFAEAGGSIYATRDWHPPNHISFQTRGGPWPIHCVQNSEGARFHPELNLPEDVIIISKGEKPDIEAYSGFKGTELESLLREEGIRKLYIGGLATDYCVKSTVIDGLKAGFDVTLLVDASKGVDVNPGDSVKAIEAMKKMGAKEASLSDFE